LKKAREKAVLGWREWLSLPDLGIKDIKAKVDTGARTSSLHAEDLEYFRRGRKDMVRFIVHPLQRSRKRTIHAEALLLEERSIRSSNGVREYRPVIETTLDMAGELWQIELTLTSRDVMGFRMLLGRQAIRGHAVVDPGRSFVTRRKPKAKAKPKAKTTPKRPVGKR